VCHSTRASRLAIAYSTSREVHNTAP
jgi:hypothetical protein